MSRRGVFPVACLVLVVVATFFVPPIEAAPRFWITPTGGAFGTPGVASPNWSAAAGGVGGATAPVAADDANFTLNNTYDVTFSAAATTAELDVENGNVTFNLAGVTYTATLASGTEIGNVVGQTGRLTILDGILGVDTAGDDVVVANLDSTGFLTIGANGQLGADPTRPDLIVADEGTGTLTVQSNGEVFAREFTIGNNFGSTGTATVTGPLASMNLSSTSIVGNNGIGTMTLSGGADLVSTSTTTIGSLGGSTGTLTITGAGSQWTQSSSMTIGDDGVGTLNVQSGGELATSATTLGSSAGSLGTVNVTGAGSEWTPFNLTIGSSGEGLLNITGGGQVAVTQVVSIGHAAGSQAAVTVSGAGSRLDEGSGMTIANGGVGSLTISAGGQVTSAGGATIGLNSMGVGEVTMTGAGSSWSLSSFGVLSVASSGAGTLTVENGGALNVGTLNINDPAGAPVGRVNFHGGTITTGGFTRLGIFNFRDGTLHVKGVYDHGAAAAPLVIDGPTSGDLPTLRLSGNFAVNDVTTITVGNNNQGALVLDGGRTVNIGSSNISIGAGPLSSGTVTLSDASLVTTGVLRVGEAGTGVLNINPGGIADAGSLILSSGGTINLNGGTLRVPSFFPVGGSIDFNAGEVAFSIATIVDDSLLDGVLGSSHVLGAGQRFSNTNGFVFNAPLTVSGGDLFSGTSISNNSTLQMDDGSLVANTNLSNSAGRFLTISGTAVVSATGGITNDGTIQLNNNLVATSGGTLTNGGTIRGSGFIGNNLTNNAAGQVQATIGSRLEFQGATNTNSGSISLVGGEIVFTGSLTNSASTGLISNGGAILRAGGGITNNGSLAVPFGVSQLFGDINNTGSVVVSGGASAVFYDDITQNGTFRVSKVGSTTSTAVVLGDFTGSGGSTGGGDIFFEGDLRPGNSAATVEFDNNIAFGSGATLEIELGGTTPGSQYDQVHVGGSLSLDGALSVSLIDGFTPTAGNSFDILDWEELAGTFDTINLPTLTGALTWDTSQLYTIGALAVVPALPGDFNFDGSVDAADYVVWRKGLGIIFTQDDYNVWTAHFGQTVGTGSSMDRNAAVPEPSSQFLLLCTAIGIRLIRRMRR